MQWKRGEKTAKCVKKSWQRRANICHVWKWNFRPQICARGLSKNTIQEDELKLFSFHLLQLQNSLSMYDFPKEESITLQYTWLSTPCGSWKFNSEPLKEQPEVAIPEPPLQLSIWNFLNFVLSQVMDWSHKWIKWTSYRFFLPKLFFPDIFCDTQKVIKKTFCKIHFNIHGRVDTFKRF